MKGNRLGVAVSGGGYRASTWALGVLLALVETRANERVQTVSSVSGGSITNAAVGMASNGFSRVSPEQFRRFSTRLAEGFAGQAGVFWAALIVNVSLMIALWISIRASWVVSAALGVALLVAAVVGTLSGDLLFGRFRVWLYLEFVFGAGVAAAVLAWGRWWWFAAAVLFIAVALQFRGPLVGSAIGASLRKLTGHSGKLGGLNDDVVHVICATELRAGHHTYFSDRFVASYDHGLGARPDLRIHAAVQASANLPFAFPTRWMWATPFEFQFGGCPRSLLALTDGGVYDNMGDQWVADLPDRIARLASLVETDASGDHPKKELLTLWRSIEPDVIIVANASGALQPRKVWNAFIPWLGELLGLLQVKDVLYDNGNSVRRNYLIYRFDRKDPVGTLIHIDSNPYKFPRRLGGPGGEAALRWLDSLEISESKWESERPRSRGVGTKLWPLGRVTTRRLISHAYVQTIANLISREIIDGPPATVGLPVILRET